MDFDLSQDLLRLQDSVKQFVEEAVLPQILKYEEQSVFPRDIFQEAGRRG